MTENAVKKTTVVVSPFSSPSSWLIGTERCLNA